MNTETMDEKISAKEPRRWLRLVNLLGAIFILIGTGLFILGFLYNIFFHGDPSTIRLLFVLLISGFFWILALVFILKWWRLHPFRLWLIVVLYPTIFTILLVASCPACHWQERYVGEDRNRMIYHWIPVGCTPQSIAFGHGSGWVSDNCSNQVTRISTPRYYFDVETIIPVGNGPVGLAIGEDAVWVTNYYDNTISRIDPETNQVVNTIEVGSGPLLLAVDKNSVWVTNQNDDTLSRVDVTTNRLTATIPVGTGPSGVVSTEKGVWVTNYDDGTVAQIAPKTNQVVATIPVGRGPGHIEEAAGDLWTTNQMDKTVSRVDQSTHQVLATIPVGETPLGMGIARDSLWVANKRDGTLSRIDLQSGEIAATISIQKWPITTMPVDIVITDDVLWLANRTGSVARLDPDPISSSQ
jgi:YVTN family beta-propeller protein